MKSAKEKMLAALMRNKGKPAFTVAQAQDRFFIDRVAARIYELRQDGYRIVSQPVVGKKTVRYGLAADGKWSLKAASRR